MADIRHLEILQEGVASWNAWRDDSPGVWPNLVGADLRQLSLSGANLCTTDLRGANLSASILRKANLAGSVLISTNLSSANLSYANLIMANLNGARLDNATMDNAEFGETILTNIDFRAVHGLRTIRHAAPSRVGIDTLYRSAGEIPLDFLQKIGVPANLIEYMPSLTSVPINYRSCFISYSSADADFANRLYSDLQSHGVNCWYAPEDMKIGEKIRISIDKAIHSHDRLLLILSSTSIESQWVEQEVEKALERERTEGQTVLFPIRVDDAILEARLGWAAFLRNSRHIGDFTRWKLRHSYGRGLDRLLRDLNQPISAKTK